MGRQRTASDTESALFRYGNRFRTANGCEQLEPVGRLIAGTRAHATAMVMKDFTGITSADGVSVSDRIGCPVVAVTGTRTYHGQSGTDIASAQLDAWKRETERETLLGDYDTTAIGVYVGKDAVGITQVFAEQETINLFFSTF